MDFILFAFCDKDIEEWFDISLNNFLISNFFKTARMSVKTNFFNFQTKVLLLNFIPFVII